MSARRLLAVRSAWRVLVLALLFAVAQSFALAHATKHDLAGVPTQSCQACVLAHLPLGLGTQTLSLPKLPERALTPIDWGSGLWVQVLQLEPRSRGPPQMGALFAA